jgi:hypothetical protein
MSTNYVDSVIIPVLTGAMSAVGVYAAYNKNERPEEGMLSPWLANGLMTAGTAMAVEQLTPYAYNNFPGMNDPKMAIEPLIVGVSSYVSLKYSGVKGISYFGPIAIGATSNVVANVGKKQILQ